MCPLVSYVQQQNKIQQIPEYYQVLETVQGVRGAENETMSVPRLLNLVEEIYEQIACAVLEV